MTTTLNKAIFRQFYEDAWNLGELGVIDELVSPSFINHELTMPVPHRDLYKQAVIETRSAFPDWTITIEDLIGEGDKVVARWTAQGTHTGAGFGLAPTGRKIKMAGLTLVRIVDGQITEFWKKDDAYTVAQQLMA